MSLTLWAQNRWDAYNGSMQHFLASLASGRIYIDARLSGISNV